MIKDNNIYIAMITKIRNLHNNNFLYVMGSLEGKSPRGFSNAQNSRLI